MSGNLNLAVLGGSVRVMMLVLSLVLGIVPLLGVAWIFLSGMISLWPPSATVDGLFMSLILLALSACFLLNAYWEMGDAGLLNLGKKPTATPAKTPSPKAS
jgi:hypothetical protein